MKAFFLRSASLFFLFCIMASGLRAQQNRFLYIQTENKQPFYVKMDKRIVNSSAEGHIIMGGLTDSTYHVSFGFPEKEWPEQNFTIMVKETDAGYFLKNLGEKGWCLFNLQTLQLLMPGKKIENKAAEETETLTDDFSTILAAVVNDPALTQRIIVRGDTQAIEKLPGITAAEKRIVNEERKPVSIKTEIIKRASDTDPEGINIVYLDIVNGVTDTIKLFIPLVKSFVTGISASQAETPKMIKKKDEASNKEARFIDMELQNPNAKPDTGKVTGQVIREKKSSSSESVQTSADSSVKGIKGTTGNSRCKNTASYEDFINLRKLMAVEESDKNMINEARKKFKKNCYTTEQVKNLGTMFLSDEGKYKFYVVAYPFVSDIQNFATLENQLTDKLFITKFRSIPH